MNWYKNTKLKVKFSIMAVVISLLILIISFLCVFLLKNVSKKYDKIVENNRALIEKSVHVTSILTELRFAQLTLDGAQSPLALGDFDKARENIRIPYEESKKALEDLKQSLDSIESLNQPEDGIDKKDEIAASEYLMETVDDYYEKYLEHINLHEQGVFHDANGKLTPEHKQHLDDVKAVAEEMFGDLKSNGAVASLSLSNFGDMINRLDLASQNAQKQATILILIGLIVMIIIIFNIIFISKSITKPINTIMDAADNVAKGNVDIDIRSNDTNEMGAISNAISNMVYIFQGMLEDINKLSKELNEGNISYKINQNKYSGVFKQAVESINGATNILITDTLDILDTVDNFGKGNFDVEIVEFKGEKIVATQTLREIQLSLKSVSNEINNLVNAANDGNLEYKIDNTTYSGNWKDTINGLNKFLENVVIPIKETQNALNQFSVGNFEHRITNEYKGEFDNIKQTVNSTAENIGSYISEISSILDEMAHKNFDVSIDREYLGDFKQIQKSVNSIVKNLNMLTKDIISSAEQVSDGAKQISESSISLAEGATEQAESVEKLNNVVKLISEQTEENTKGSNKANSLAIETRENASKGSKQMNDMLEAMEEINTASNSISNIIKVIDDIAFQTKILALNAAVEAARAGEHGKGFAVVAEEVRNLAARSQQAARETTELIESSVQKVEEGSRIANSTAKALLDIVTQIEDISSLVETCAKSSNEQEKSISEIRESISQISIVTQNNTATSEESAAAAQELASQAELFYSSVADFKLKDDSSLDIE